MRHIKEICIKRDQCDAFQNVYCPAISKSKLTCNTNVVFLFPGPSGEYCFNYSMKCTQFDDSEPYENIKNSIGKILAGIKYEDNNEYEAVRRLLATSFKHQSNNAIRPTLAAYLTRNKSRFIFSHEFVFCPLLQLKSLTIGEDISVNVSFCNKNPRFQCSAIHYLCRPLTLQLLSPYEFFSNYQVVKFSKKQMQNGAERLINTAYFKHPSYNSRTGCCSQVVAKRLTKALIQVPQYSFTDSANFECNILLGTSPISEEIENYSHLVVLLFLPYRCDSDLKMDNKYTTLLRYVVQNDSIIPDYSNFLQNIQDSKANSFRFKLKGDELERSAEPFHDTLTQENLNESNIEDAIPALNPNQLIDLTDFLNLENHQQCERFLPNNMNVINFSIDLLRARGIDNCGYDCLPLVQHTGDMDPLYSEAQSLIILSENNNTTDRAQPNSVETISMEKDWIALVMGYDQEVSMNFSEITGNDENIDVALANGTAKSIVDWAVKCKLDPHQRRAFEIITGYYVLSYIYGLKDLEEADTITDFINEETKQLEQLVGHDKINSKQLICFLHGPGGSGKTTVISLLKLYSKKYHIELDNQSYNRSIIITAMTGVAATIIGGETIHSAVYLNHQKEEMEPDKVELWTNTKLLVIDEISFATNDNINTIHKNLGKLKQNKFLPFGGIHVIFCGDLRQLEPVHGYPLYKNHETISSLFKIHTNCYIELHGKHRFIEDPVWGEILMRFREGRPTTQDIKDINSRKQIKSEKMPIDIKYATFKNRDRDSINTAIFQEKLEYSMLKCQHTTNFLMIFCDNIKTNKDGKYIPLINTKYFYENCGESNLKSNRHGRIDPVLKLYIGCEVMLTENIDVYNGLANGTTAKVKNIIIKQASQQFNVNIGNNTIVKGIYASNIECIHLTHNNQNIQNQSITIKPKTTNFHAQIPLPINIITMNSKLKSKPIQMTANQLPIIVNNATTGHKLQGSGVDKLFVHGWNYRKNWPYVVISRVKTIEGLFLRKLLNRHLEKYKMDPDLVSLITYFQKLLPDI